MTNQEVHEVDGKTRKLNLRMAWVIGVVVVIGMMATFWALKELTGQ